MNRKLKTVERNCENDILESYESGEWKSVANLGDEVVRFASNAAATRTKDKMEPRVAPVKLTKCGG